MKQNTGNLAGKLCLAQNITQMEQEVLGIRDPAGKQDTSSPSSHRTSTWREAEVREAENKHVAQRYMRQSFRLIHAMKKSEEGYRWR